MDSCCRRDECRDQLGVVRTLSEDMLGGLICLVQHVSFSDVDYIWCTLRFLPPHCDL